MSGVILQCPSCGHEVHLGDIECAHCGVNLKSGEAFETRVKKAKSKEEHPEHFVRGIYFAVVAAFGVILFAGLMYQNLVERTLKQKPDLFGFPVFRMQEIDDLVAVGRYYAAQGDARQAGQYYQVARKAAQELLGWIDAQVTSIGLPDPYTADRRRSSEPEYNEHVARRILRDLRAKAASKLARIPTA